MSRYLSAERLSQALQQLGHSRAKRTPLFDFLIVKRTLAIKGQDRVPITENEPAFLQALEEIGGCGKVDGKDARPGHPYLNFFAIKEKEKTGYRPAKYKSNGTNTNISGTQWPPVITLTEDRPRQASLTPGYEANLADLALSNNKKLPLPSLSEAAIWNHRGQDVEAIIAGAADDKAKLEKLTERFEQNIGLTSGEITAVFDEAIDPKSPEGGSIFVDEQPSPLDYLPGKAAPTPREAGENLGVVSFDLVVALTAKNFVILTGPSGTGKSRAALKLAEALQLRYADKIDGSIFELIPVGPDWTSPKRLLGYKTPFGKERLKKDGTKTHESYEITDTLRLILRASHPDAAEIPHFLIFDEMNLSHVERYFAPFLSLMEASNILDEERGVSLIDTEGFMIINELLQADEADSREAEAALMLINEGRSFVLPPNLFFVGTVNVDETTYMFSPKVLDRAHVIELNSDRPSAYLLGGTIVETGGNISVDLADQLLQSGIEDREGQKNELPNPADILDRLSAIDFTDSEIATIKTLTVRALDGCYDLLAPVGFPFGYRISKEVFVYLLAWITARLQAGDDKARIMQIWQDGLDHVLLQKVLPKIHGNRRLLGDSLKAMAAFLGGHHAGSTPPASYTIGMGKTVAIPEEHKLSLVGPDGQLAHSIAKLTVLHDRLNATGYVSFVS